MDKREDSTLMGKEEKEPFLSLLHLASSSSSSTSSSSSSASSSVGPPTRLQTEICRRHLVLSPPQIRDSTDFSSLRRRRRRQRRAGCDDDDDDAPVTRPEEVDETMDRSKTTTLTTTGAEATPSTEAPPLEALLREKVTPTTTTTTTAATTTTNSNVSTRNSKVSTTKTENCRASSSPIHPRDSRTSSWSSSSSSSSSSTHSPQITSSSAPNDNDDNNNDEDNFSSFPLFHRTIFAASRSTSSTSSFPFSSSWRFGVGVGGSGSRSLTSFLLATALLLTTSLPVGVDAWRQRNDRRQCEHITIPMCRGIGYNLTYMPNQFNHETQEEAGLEVHQFWPLVEIQCSPHLRFFLCSMYAPICIPNYHKPLPACRNVCEQAKQGCAPIMRQYGFAWPERMNCDGLPEYGDPNNLCMGWEYNQTSETATTPPSPPPSSGDKNKDDGNDKNNDYKNNYPVNGDDEKCSCSCKDRLVQLTSENHAEVFNRGITTGSVPNCAKPCQSMYFNRDERAFVSFWIGLWAILCGLSTLLTCLTFFIDMERFQYPERPIIFMSGCYLMVSVGYIVRLAVGHQDIACNGDIIRYQATGPAVCTVVFILIYFFGMAACIWWVCLSFTWFLAAGLKWGSEAIASYSQYFHLAAWFIPAVKTIAVLAMSSVDGDPVSGICFVGNQNLANLRGFVLAPHCAYLLVGILFLLAGFISLFRIRSVIKQQGHSRADKLEKLMIRIGIFTVLYTVPASIVIACLFYEQYYREAWEHAVTCACDGENEKAAAARAGMRPDYAVFMLKYFMCLVVGITSGFWIWSGKTLESWRRFNSNLCRRRDDCNPHHSSPSPTHQRLYCKSITPPPSKNMPISHV